MKVIHSARLRTLQHFRFSTEGPICLCLEAGLTYRLLTMHAGTPEGTVFNLTGEEIVIALPDLEPLPNYNRYTENQFIENIVLHSQHRRYHAPFRTKQEAL